MANMKSRATAGRTFARMRSGEDRTDPAKTQTTSAVKAFFLLAISAGETVCRSIEGITVRRPAGGRSVS